MFCSFYQKSFVRLYELCTRGAPPPQLIRNELGSYLISGGAHATLVVDTLALLATSGLRDRFRAAVLSVIYSTLASLPNSFGVTVHL